MEKKNNKWFWLDGSQINYQNFKNNETKGDFGTFAKGDGKWIIHSRLPNKMSFICKFSNEHSTTVKSTAVTSPFRSTTTKTTPTIQTTQSIPKPTSKSSGMSPGAKATIALVILMIIALIFVVLLYYRYNDSPEIRDMKNAGRGGYDEHGPSFNNPIRLEGNNLTYGANGP